MRVLTGTCLTHIDTHKEKCKVRDELAITCTWISQAGRRALVLVCMPE